MYHVQSDGQSPLLSSPPFLVLSLLLLYSSQIHHGVSAIIPCLTNGERFLTQNWLKGPWNSHKTKNFEKENHNDFFSNGIYCFYHIKIWDHISFQPLISYSKKGGHCVCVTYFGTYWSVIWNYFSSCLCYISVNCSFFCNTSLIGILQGTSQILRKIILQAHSWCLKLNRYLWESLSISLPSHRTNIPKFLPYNNNWFLIYVKCLFTNIQKQ